MSLISRLRAVVAGDDYLDGDLDDLAYDDDHAEPLQHTGRSDGGALATLGDSNPFDLSDELGSSNVIGMPGISSAAAEVNLMEPRSFDEMPQAIQACVTVTNTNHEEASSPTVVSREPDLAESESSAPSPAWGSEAL